MLNPSIAVTDTSKMLTLSANEQNLAWHTDHEQTCNPSNQRWQSHDALYR